MGADVQLDGDDLRVVGAPGLENAFVNSEGDHRMAMALAVAASVADGETSIENAEAAVVSYPSFFDTLLAISQ
jgi:3-phosphoshikimate 1-carboxyvinyltransferase